MIRNLTNKLFDPQPTTHNPQPNSGQVVLMLVLITIVGLTIGLSLISRTVTDVRISSQIEQSQRAFSAAEAGIESAFKTSLIGVPTGTVNLPDASASYSVSQIGGTPDAVTFPLTSPDTARTFWLAEHDSGGALSETSGNSYAVDFSFDLCWGTDPSTDPAIAVSLFYRTGASAPYDYRVERGSYDPLSVRGNNFTLAESGGSNYCGGNYRFRKNITPKTDFGVDPTVSKLLFLRIRPVYANAILALLPKPPAIFPVQSRIVSSVGKTATGVVRKIQANQGYNELPAMFDFGLFVEN